MNKTNLFDRIKIVTVFFLEQPVGIAISLSAFLLLIFAPQTDGMLIGLLESYDKKKAVNVDFWGIIGLSMASIFLGFLAWYWTFSGLTREVRVRLCSSFWENNRNESLVYWAQKWVSLFAFLCGILIVFIPIFKNFTLWPVDYQLIFIMPPVMIFFLFTWDKFFLFFTRHNRKAEQLNCEVFPLKKERWRTLSLILDGPYSWQGFIVILFVSLIGIYLVIYHPLFIEKNFETPTAAIVSFAIMIAPLIISFVIVKDLIYLFFNLINKINYKPAKNLIEFFSTLDSPIGSKTVFISFAGIFVFLWLLYIQDYFDGKKDNGIYLINQLKTQEPIPERENLKQTLKEWTNAKFPDNKEKIPVIIVAAQGGASRAAVWLLSSMQMLDSHTKGEFTKHLFAISSVSGGSLGAVTYLHFLNQFGDEHGRINWKNPALLEALKELGKADLLAASISSYIVNDTLRRFFGYILSDMPNRSDNLEKAFERYWQNHIYNNKPNQESQLGFIQLYMKGNYKWPHLLLNGTDVDTGSRIITSTFKFKPKELCTESSDIKSDQEIFFDSYDFIYEFNNKDIPSSAAVMNSARFPFLSPSGQFKDRNDIFRHLVDGGYYDNYGASTALELAKKIEKINEKYVPIIVVISNDVMYYRDAESRELDKKNCCKKRTWLELLFDKKDSGCECNKNLQIPILKDGVIQCGNLKSNPLLKPCDDKFPIQLSAPAQGVLAIRNAYGRQSLIATAQYLCENKDQMKRMIHIDLPLPVGKEESAPLNWVLNGLAQKYLLEKAPKIKFLEDQAKELNKTIIDIYNDSK